MAKASSSRRAAREVALRVLYTMDVGKQSLDEVLTETLEANEERLDEKTTTFAKNLVTGTWKARREIDMEIDRFAVGFPTNRQTAVDRNILRLAAAEILFQVSDAPPGAVVNEAVELAKKYSTAESGRFVNGILGTLVREFENRQPVQNSSMEKEGEPQATVETIAAGDETLPKENTTE